MRTRLTQARDDRDQGFTLIELLVVVIIIGILAAIAIPVFLNQRKKGVDASIKSDLKNAATAVETWATDFPSTAIVGGSAVMGASYTAATPDTGTTGQADVATDTAIAGFRPSPGNTITVAPNSTANRVGAYCLFGWNGGASAANAAGAQLKYDSYAGGLQTGTVATTACT